VEMKVKHLEMIQGVVNRLSTNSFLLKGWSVVLVSALFALAAKEANPLFAYLAYFPTGVFWALDGYFLHQERLFRALYDRVRMMAEEEVDYSMDTSPVQQDVPCFWCTVFSKTLAFFHGTVFGTVVLIMAILVFTT
jgi:hypothetical protein